MIIGDYELARHFLSYVSYYRLAGYWWPLQSDKKKHIFKPNSQFQTVVDLYNFDRELRLIVFNMIERIEIGIRTLLIYHLSINYGAWWFENQDLFKNKHYFQNHIKEIKKEIVRSREVFIEQHNNKYNADHRCPPAWKTLEVISLGLLSKLYNNLKNNLPEKKLISKQLHAGNHTFLSSWLRSISVVRNICAHHSRLWNRNLPVPPKMLTRTDKPWLQNPSLVDVHSLYSVLCCMYFLLRTISPGNRFKLRLTKLLNSYPIVDKRAMGFTDTWDSEDLWRTEI